VYKDQPGKANPFLKITMFKSDVLGLKGKLNIDTTLQILFKNRLGRRRRGPIRGQQMSLLTICKDFLDDPINMRVNFLAERPARHRWH
jgi:hypothetical protein